MNNEEMTAFLNMMQSVDAFFPIGAFTLSNGLETYVQQEVFQSIDDLDSYLKEYLHIFPQNDLGMMYLAWECRRNLEKIRELDRLAGAMKPAKEIREGCHKTGIRFLKAEKQMHHEEGGTLGKYRQMI